MIAGDGCLNVHPGLSSYAPNPRKAGESLRPLFEYAVKMGVPTGTKVYLAATAGLRALPQKSQVDQIIDSVR
jgi:apyrase